MLTWRLSDYLAAVSHGRPYCLPSVIHLFKYQPQASLFSWRVELLVFQVVVQTSNSLVRDRYRCV
ncbi:hypothetical protein NLY39_16925 [Pseudomonas sp. KHPS1]|nr:hypothetical protein [Pseudomonas sp. KHPS1]ATH81147.1 hypothetical protein CO724_08265 [Pseudomonas mendocina]UTH35344.1 hypothetical protein NLY39_16925 [Pseudomonas sp. KHPS1]